MRIIQPLIPNKLDIVAPFPCVGAKCEHCRTVFWSCFSNFQVRHSKLLICRVHFILSAVGNVTGKAAFVNPPFRRSPGTRNAFHAQNVLLVSYRNGTRESIMQQQHVDEQIPDDEQKPHSEQIRENTQAVVEGAQREVAAARIPWYRTIKRSQILLVLYALQVALFAILAWWVHYHPVLPVDVAITREFQENQNPWLRFTMLAVSYIGAVLLLSVGLILVAAVLL